MCVVWRANEYVEGEMLNLGGAVFVWIRYVMMRICKRGWFFIVKFLGYIVLLRLIVVGNVVEIFLGILFRVGVEVIV